MERQENPGTMGMIGNRETFAETAEQESNGAPLRPDGARTRPVPDAELTPPPPSAPTEFLFAQWVPVSPPAQRETPPGGLLTPPPPSAPSEFLAAQWSDCDQESLDTSAVVLSAIEEAATEVVAAIEDLERLAIETDGAPESSPADGDAPPDNAVPQRRIRGVPLDEAEQVERIFLPEEGMVASLPRSGQALILTNRRLIAFRGVEGYRDTHMADAFDITQCSVRNGQRNWGAVIQGLMIIAGGAFLYLIVGYWLAGQVSGPSVPVLNIDVAPLIALLIILAGMIILVQNYFTRPAGAMIFHGEGIEIAFPFRSSLELEQVYEFVDSAQATRRAGRERQQDCTSGNSGHSGTSGETDA